MKTLKNKFITRTGRESMLYKLADIALQKWNSSINWIENGHIIRHKNINTYLASQKVRKLHIGCGKIKLEGFLNSDMLGKIPIDIRKRLPFPSNSFDLVFSYHLIEHIYAKDAKTFLHESHRILKPNGTLIIGTPSIEKIAKALYCDTDPSHKNLMLDYHKKFTHTKKVMSAEYINDVTHIYFGHKYIYDMATMSHLAKNAGFANVKSISRQQVPNQEIRESLPKEGTFRDIQSEIFLIKKR